MFTHANIDVSPESKLALVLSGGGPRGAMQVGALRALMEANIVPDMIVGTSVGAINGAYLARFGYNLSALEHLIEVWEHTARGDFAPGDFFRAILRNILPTARSNGYFRQASDFHARHGITPDLRFGDLIGPDLYIVTSDISHHRATIFGLDPDDLVLDSMLASSAIPPWIPPLPLGDGLHIDGGAVSDVPIEPALRLGATEMIVLDLFNPSPPTNAIPGVTSLAERVITTMQVRHLDLELALAELTKTPIHRMLLRYDVSIPLWDMSHTPELMSHGYEVARAFVAEMPPLQETQSASAPPSWRRWLGRLTATLRPSS